MESLEYRSIEFRVSDAALSLLAKKCYRPEYGARHARRTIEELVGKQLSDYLLENRGEPGILRTLVPENVMNFSQWAFMR